MVGWYWSKNMDNFLKFRIEEHPIGSSSWICSRHWFLGAKLRFHIWWQTSACNGFTWWVKNSVITMIAHDILVLTEKFRNLIEFNCYSIWSAYLKQFHIIHEWYSDQYIICLKELLMYKRAENESTIFRYIILPILSEMRTFFDDVSFYFLIFLIVHLYLTFEFEINVIGW